MTKTMLMTRYKTKFGGSYVKENGRWFWIKGNERHLVTTGWLLAELKKPRKTKFHKNMEPTPEPKTPVVEEVKEEVKEEVVEEVKVVKLPKRHIQKQETEENE